MFNEKKVKKKFRLYNKKKNMKYPSNYVYYSTNNYPKQVMWHVYLFIL